MTTSIEDLKKSLKYVVNETDFGFLGNFYSGKVRDCYVKGDTRYLITTDRLSCFDVVLTTIPFKGQVLTELAVIKFEESKDIIENHIIDLPDPNVMVVQNCEILPIEVVVRGYLTGSAWRDYQSGKMVSGIRLSDGMRESQKFEAPLLTPSTKAEKGLHDMPISEQEIIEGGHVPKKVWEEVREKAMQLFEAGSRSAQARGLILVDTKYEFGMIDGKLILADEIHTLDCSRYWVESSYLKCFEAGDKPEMLDKEPIRQWLLSQGYSGTGTPPEFTDVHRAELAQHYIHSFEQVSGKEFKPRSGDVVQDIRGNLLEYQQSHGDN